MKKILIPLLVILQVLIVFAACEPDDEKIITDIEEARQQFKNIDEVISELQKLFKKVHYKEILVEQAVIEGDIEIDVLPDITEFDIVTGSKYDDPNKIQIEIFASTEKSTPTNPDDRWLVDVAQDFNSQNIKSSTGKPIEIQIRRIASGTGHEFIKAKKYIPDAYSPSNELWVRMIETAGIETIKIEESLVPNYAGLVIDKEVEKKLKDEYGTVSFNSIVDAVIKKKISAAYTNPKASSTGLNMLYTILLELANNDKDEIFADKIVHSFEIFQEKVPLIATTTLHLRDLFAKGSRLNAFPTEYQTFQKMENKDDLKFIPFGVLHNNPLYGIKMNITPEKQEGLKKFANFAKSDKYTKLADKFGFKKIDYNGIPEPSGATLLKAQNLWKEHKDSGKTVYAYFLTDTSGSMESSSKLAKLKLALGQAIKKINEKNYVGLMEFNSNIINRLDLAPFDFMQKGKFLTALDNFVAGGGTAMYDGIVSALLKLLDYKKKDPNGKFYLFVLTDGERNEGYYYSDIFDVMVGAGIRIYPIAYGDVGKSELEKLAVIGETGLIVGNVENIVQKLITLFDLSL